VTIIAIPVGAAIAEDLHADAAFARRSAGMRREHSRIGQVIGWPT